MQGIICKLRFVTLRHVACFVALLIVLVRNATIRMSQEESVTAAMQHNSGSQLLGSSSSSSSSSCSCSGSGSGSCCSCSSSSSVLSSSSRQAQPQPRHSGIAPSTSLTTPIVTISSHHPTQQAQQHHDPHRPSSSSYLLQRGTGEQESNLSDNYRHGPGQFVDCSFV